MEAAMTFPSCRPFARSMIFAVSAWPLRVVAGVKVLKAARPELSKDLLYRHTPAPSGNLVLVLTIVQAEFAKRARILEIMFMIPQSNVPGAAPLGNAFDQKRLIKVVDRRVQFLLWKLAPHSARSTRTAERVRALQDVYTALQKVLALAIHSTIF